MRMFHPFLILLFLICMFGCTQPTADDSNRAHTEVRKHIEASYAKDSSPPLPWDDQVLWKRFSESNRASFTAKVTDTSPIFEFTIKGMFERNNLDPQLTFLPQYVEIKDASSKKIINKFFAKNRFAQDGWMRSWGEPIQLVDVNFDGYLDLRILNWAGATGNNKYATYLFNPISKKFTYSERLSDLCGILLDTNNKTIVTYERDGWCYEYMEYYEVKNTDLIFKKAEWTEMDRTRDEEVGGPACFKYTGIPRHNNVRVDFQKVFYSKDNAKYMKTKMKDIKEEVLYGSLDGRERGPLGNPY